MTNEQRKEAGIETLPENLYEAVQCMKNDKFVCDVLGDCLQPYVLADQVCNDKQDNPLDQLTGSGFPHQFDKQINQIGQ